jgi:ribonuclease BN (tRNA processing enzyme)
MLRLVLAIALATAGCAAGPGSPVGAPPRPQPRACAAEASSAGATKAALEVVVLGSGGPVPSGRACASHALLVDGVPRLLVDVGPGAAVRLGEAGLDVSALDTLLLTHLHVDHAADLPAVVKARDLAAAAPLAFFVAGPAGHGDYPATSQLVAQLFDQAFAYLRTFKNRLDLRTLDLPIARDGSTHVVMDAPGLRVVATATDHGDAPAIAYRIEHAGHAVVFGGDTALGDDAVAKLANGADLFVANATVLDPPLAPAGLYKLHASPSRIGEVARAANVRAVLLAHLGDAVISEAPDVLRSIHRSFAGPVALAHDCERVGVR